MQKEKFDNGPRFRYWIRLKKSPFVGIFSGNQQVLILTNLTTIK